MNIDDVISAARKSERAWCEQIAEGESTDFGVAHASTRFPNLPDANQLRDAWIADADPNAVYEQAESWYRQRGATCRIWTPASGQAVEPVERLLLGKGWRRADLLALGLVAWDAAVEMPSDVRILPARAMRRAYAASVERSSNGGEAEVEAASERLDDSNFDSVVAQVQGETAGRIAYLEVGDIARLADFWVAPAHRGGPAERVLIAHFLQTARRLLPRAIVACVDASDTEARTCLERSGFAVAGALARFVRNAD